MLLSTRKDTSLPQRHSLEFFFFFFFRACMCVSVCMAVLPRAKCILRAVWGRGGGAPADLQSLVRDGLFSLRQVRALQSLVDTPPIGKIAGGFVSSLASRFGLFFPPTGLRKRSWNGLRPPTPRESKLRIDGSCLTPPPQSLLPRLGLGGQENSRASSTKSRTWRCMV